MASDDLAHAHLQWGDLVSLYALWQDNQEVQSFPAGKILRIPLPDAALMLRSTGEWQTVLEWTARRRLRT